MIALWSQKAAQSKLPRPGLIPPLLYSIARNTTGSFLDITQGTNVVFSSVACCKAAKGYDMASGAAKSPLDTTASSIQYASSSNSRTGPSASSGCERRSSEPIANDPAAMKTMSAVEHVLPVGDSRAGRMSLPLSREGAQQPLIAPA